MLCAVRRHQSLNTSICLDSAPFDSPPFSVQLLPKINDIHDRRFKAGISFRKVNSDFDIQFQKDNFKQICCLFTQTWDNSAAGCLTHGSKDGSISGLDPIKSKPKLGTEQRPKDFPIPSNPQKSAAPSNPNSSTPPPEALHQLTCVSPVPPPNPKSKRQTPEGLPLTPSQRPPIQNEAIDKITTLNSHLYDPGPVDSNCSTPTVSTTSSPVLEQAHPQLFPDNYNQGERRDSIVSQDSTVAASSPRPRGIPRASRGDAVLISFLAPDQPQIALRAGESPLFWLSGSESTETEMETENGDHDRPGGGDGDNDSRSMSRQQSDEGVNGNGNMDNGEGNSTDGGATKGGDGGGEGGGGDERKGNSGDGGKEKGNGANGSGGENNDKEEEKKEEDKKDKKKANEMEQLTSDADAMDIDEGPNGGSVNGEQKLKKENDGTNDGDTSMGRKDSNAMEVEAPSSEAAVNNLMALAGAAGKDQQPFSSGASLPAIFPTSTSGGSWAPTPHAQSPPGQHLKLPLPNSSPSLPSIMNTPSASSPPNSLPGGDGRHTTLPPVSSIHVLADIAEKESSQQQQTTWANNNPAQSPGLPPPAQAAHGYGPDGNPRPPMHHLSLQQRQILLSQEYYPPHHQHYQSPYPPIKDASSNGNPNSFGPNFGRELPGIMSSPPPSGGANFFAQQHNMPSTITGRRDSAFEYYSEHTPPSGPSTGETMASSDETVTSPRNRAGMPAGNQGALSAGVFKCEYQGCKAQPFQTQYLLNSHANVHSSARPHYCPVKGCTRAEGGKGFKRKNEMIRHGLVHDSPGYVCPFCPDREHKYPRPDNLQRHVRVHHMDKDKDDPQLRDVLSQRPEGGNRGRRRRLGA
ncbi:uncharacterized protein LAJ45_00787 [Morchella importuna]|uniref:uncharacterized protein n=1 Tax=Morchella importuna TaxID=1174673 RepID=UPI001E8D1A3A|nr:uncharacterized protein LAJ45_00787 [Morchella importuna]KAH8155775.1 hypothetical protein LAJ45_00787 [Morchella importuna]